MWGPRTWVPDQVLNDEGVSSAVVFLVKPNGLGWWVQALVCDGREVLRCAHNDIGVL